MATIPQKYIMYGDVPRCVIGVEEGGFNCPRAVLVHYGNIHVADCLNKRISVVNSAGQHMGTYTVPGYPRDIAVTRDGHVAVTLDSHQVAVMDISNQELGILDQDPVASDNPCYMYNSDNQKMHTIEVTKIIGQYGQKVGEFDRPGGVTTDLNGLLYVCDRHNNRVQVLDPSGSVVRVIGSLGGPGRLMDSWSIAIHPKTRDIYVTTRVSDGTRRVNIYSHDGQYIDHICGADIPGGEEISPYYVSFRHDGVLCISDWASDGLHIMKDGTYLQKIGGRGKANGQLLKPWSTAFTPFGDLVVADWDNHRVQTFTTSTVTASTGRLYADFTSTTVTTSNGHICSDFQ